MVMSVHRQRWCVPASAAVICLAILIAAPPVEAGIVFSDVSQAAGIGGDIYHSSGRHGLGVNWIDFDGDGWPDLFVVGGRPGQPSHLFRNLGDGTFSRNDELLPTLPAVEMSGSRFADIDGDGDQDLFIYTDNESLQIAGNNVPDGPPNILLRNLWVENGNAAPEGQALFESIAAAAGVDDLAPLPFGALPAYRSKTASFFDHDRDGCIDLFVGHMVINHAGEAFNKDRLYRNLCDGTFADVTEQSGLYAGNDPETYRAALASGAFHLDDDLWPDLYVVNVSFRDHQPLLDDQIYRNGGPSGPMFTNITATMPGVGNDAEAGMGIDVADIDLDGDWDLYISDIYQTKLDELPLGNVLYLGDGTGGFGDNTAPAAGVQGDSAWGVNFLDADSDGWEDLYIATIAGTDGVFYRNEGVGGNGQAGFAPVANAAGLQTSNARGSAVADYDRDGQLDIAVVNQDGQLQLFRNETQGAGHWLVVELDGRVSNRDAIGAIVEVTTAGVVRRRQIKGGSSAHSQNALAVHFGLGSASQIEALRVRWPSGIETNLANLPVDRYLRIVETFIFQHGFEAVKASR